MRLEDAGGSWGGWRTLEDVGGSWEESLFERSTLPSKKLNFSHGGEYPSKTMGGTGLTQAIVAKWAIV